MIITLLSIATEVTWETTKWSAYKTYAWAYKQYYGIYPYENDIDNEHLSKKIKMLELKIKKLEDNKKQNEEFEKLNEIL
jgi:hypothetical protein